MSTEENKAVSRRFHEAVGKGSAQALQEEFAPNYVAHFPGVPVPLDSEGFNQLVNVFATGFPDSHFDLDDVFAVGDKVVTRWRVQGTNTGSLFGMPATNKSATFTGITINRIAGDKIAEQWVNFDALGMMQQLGLLPAPGQAS